MVTFKDAIIGIVAAKTLRSAYVSDYVVADRSL